MHTMFSLNSLQYEQVDLGIENTERLVYNYTSQAYNSQTLGSFALFL